MNIGYMNNSYNAIIKRVVTQLKMEKGSDRDISLKKIYKCPIRT